jgi:hypothetical protein
MIIKGIWHVYLVNHWYSIVVDQLRILLTSGLYEASTEISIGVVQPHNSNDVITFKRLVVDLYPKLQIKYVSDCPEDFEFRTLQLIEADEGDYAGYYFHTKGVTKPGDTIVNHWRAWLNEAILNDWRHHHHNILIGYDVSSVNHCKPPLHPEHFSGNFWWFDRKYINRLPKVESLKKTNRWQAEQWICMGHGRFYAHAFKEPGTDTFVIDYNATQS